MPCCAALRCVVRCLLSTFLPGSSTLLAGRQEAQSKAVLLRPWLPADPKVVEEGLNDPLLTSDWAGEVHPLKRAATHAMQCDSGAASRAHSGRARLAASSHRHVWQHWTQAHAAPDLCRAPISRPASPAQHLQLASCQSGRLTRRSGACPACAGTPERSPCPSGCTTVTQTSKWAGRRSS